MPDIDQQHRAPLWSWAEIAQALTGERISGPDITGVTIDSRQVKPGDLFIALHGDPGPRFNPGQRSTIDGHDFVQAAADAGAAGALVHRSRENLPAPGRFPLLRVQDTYDGLWDLGRAARRRLTGPVIAITGSSGKTTAKTFLAHALGAYAPPGSFNNHIGVPLSLANAPSDTHCGVFEIGTNHPGEILPLATMVNAQVSMVLNVHQAHIENFKNLLELKAEKTSIFNPLSDKSNAISEDEIGLDYGLTFGVTPSADARISDLEGDRATIRFDGKTWTARVPGMGLHRAKTVAATLLTCHLVRQNPQLACELPPDLVPTGRGNRETIGTITLIDDSYNANPGSMRAALESFVAREKAHHKVAIVGEMLELGADAHKAHMSLVPLLKSVERVICVGRGTKAIAEVLGASWFEVANADTLSAIVLATEGHGAILVKGSNRVFWANNFVQQLRDTLHATMRST